MKSQTKILLPNGYLSWSQLNLFTHSPERYRKVYVLRERGFTNSAMEYGKKLADALDIGDNGEDPLITAIRILLPKYSVIEKEIKVKYKDLIFLGKLDSYDPPTHNIYEYKTGKVKWTQRRVDKHQQLDFYAMLVYLKYKKIPKVKLIWAETEEVDGEISATGNIQEFTRKIKLKDILIMISKASRISKEISKMYREEIKKIF